MASEPLPASGTAISTTSGSGCGVDLDRLVHQAGRQGAGAEVGHGRFIAGLLTSGVFTTTLAGLGPPGKAAVIRW